ncbi:hypothetical protein D3C84_685770 [compost metagenome]
MPQHLVQAPALTLGVLDRRLDEQLPDQIILMQLGTLVMHQAFGDGRLGFELEFQQVRAKVVDAVDGLEQPVPHTGHQRVGQPQDGAHVVGQRDKVGRMPTALLVVTGKNRRRRPPLEDRGELPGDVGDITQAGIEPLPGPGRGNMRRIPHQCHTALDKARRDPRVMGVGADPDDFQLIDRIANMPADQIPDRRLFAHPGLVFALQEHELPAPLLIRQVDADEGSLRVGMQGGVRCIQGVVGRVDHHPFTRMGQP